MKEKRVSRDGAQGGARRHDDPPAWLDKSLPLEKRRRLLDLAIKAAAPMKPPGDDTKK